MKILHGYCKGVAEKGEGDKRWAIVGIEETFKDRDGFDSTRLYKLRVFGNSYKDGIHSAYKDLVGCEVFAPYDDELDTKYERISYTLVGPPLKIKQPSADVRPGAVSSSASPVSQSQPLPKTA